MCCVQATVGVAEGTAAVTTDLDIYRTDNLLIREHGGQAAIEAAQRADAMLDKGDLHGKAAWRKVLGR